MMVKRDLTKSLASGKDEKEVLHCEFDLRGSNLAYISGDALGIYPLNHAAEVDTLITSLAGRGRAKDSVDIPSVYAPAPEGNKLALRDALIRYYDLKVAKPEFVRFLVDRSSAPNEKARGNSLLAAGLGKENEVLTEYLHLREMADVLTDFPSALLTVPEMLSFMKLLQPRYYSISSSPHMAADGSLVTVTAAVVRYETMGKPRFPSFLFPPKGQSLTSPHLTSPHTVEPECAPPLLPTG